MHVDIWASLLGGIGLFLLGMQMMTAGLTQAAGPALRSGLDSATRSRLRAFVVGTGITALVQSSSAVIVASIGFANAGLVGFGHLIWVIYGTSLGNTMTGWIVALMGTRFSIGALALPLLGVGMILRLILRGRERAAGAGAAIAGFGAFFLGIGNLQAAFADLTPQILGLTGMLSGSRWESLAFFAIGMAMTLLTQSSSATIAIVLGAAAGGALVFQQAAALIVGASVGTTSTAVFAAIGATSAAKRVAAGHVGFNLIAGAIAIVLLPVLTPLCLWLVGGAAHVVPGLALFHTSYILIGAAVMVPLNPGVVRFLESRFRKADRQGTSLHYVDATLRDLPDLALRAVALEFSRILRAHFHLARSRIADAPLAEDAQSNLADLGGQLRRELAELGRQPLPPEQVQAMSDGIRVLIYLDELSRHIKEMPDRPAAGILSLAEPAFAAQIAIAQEGLQMPWPAETRHGFVDRVADSRHAYEQIKSRLLAGMTRGECGFAEAESALAYSKTLWDIVVLALKIQTILMPWLEREELVAAPDAPPGPETPPGPGPAEAG